MKKIYILVFKLFQLKHADLRFKKKCFEICVLVETAIATIAIKNVVWQRTEELFNLFIRFVISFFVLDL